MHPGSASAAVPVEEERLGSTPLRVARCDGRVLTRLLLEEEVIKSLPEGATNGVLGFNDRWVHLISDAVLRGHLEETLDCVVTPARIVTRFDSVHNVDGTSGRSQRTQRGGGYATLVYPDFITVGELFFLGLQMDFLEGGAPLPLLGR